MVTCTVVCQMKSENVVHDPQIPNHQFKFDFRDSKKILIPIGAVRKTLVDREPLSLVDVLSLNNFKSNYMYMMCWAGS